MLIVGSRGLGQLNGYIHFFFSAHPCAYLTTPAQHSPRVDIALFNPGKQSQAYLPHAIESDRTYTVEMFRPGNGT